MIQLHTMEDLTQLEGKKIHPLIKRHLADYLRHMLSEFLVSDISDYGSIFYLEEPGDVERLPIHINETSYDVAVRIAIHDDNDDIDIVLVLYEVDGKALVLFADPQIIEPIIIGKESI